MVESATIYHYQTTNFRKIRNHPLPEAREAFRQHGHQFKQHQFYVVSKQVAQREHQGVIGITTNYQKHLLRIGAHLDVGTFRCGYLYGTNHPMLGGKSAER